MTVKEISKLIKIAKIDGDENRVIKTFSPIDNIESESIVCVDKEKFLEQALESKASVIVLKSIDKELPKDKTIIFVDNVKETFIKLLHIFSPKKETKHCIEASAKISNSSIISPTSYIGEYVVIGKNSKVGDNTTIEANTVIGDDVIIGENCYIYANTTIHNRTIIKDRVIIGSGSVIGTDGFGYSTIEGKHVKIPQIGNVIICNDVELGASVCIDRATLGSTLIEEGVKIDNLVHIAHNCKIGAGSIIVAQVGIAGSSSMGKYTILGGQVGIADHVEIGDNTIVAAQSGIMSNAKVEGGRAYFGSPIQELSREKLSIIAYKKLPELIELVESKFETKIRIKKD